MGKRRLLVTLSVITLLIVVAALSWARFKIDEKAEGECGGGNQNDSFCTCISITGSEVLCSGFKQDPNEPLESWGTTCDENGLCRAWTHCEDGTTVSCQGEYDAKADESGVFCRDTGSDLGVSDYCPST